MEQEFMANVAEIWWAGQLTKESVMVTLTNERTAGIRDYEVIQTFLTRKELRDAHERKGMYTRDDDKSLRWGLKAIFGGNWEWWNERVLDVTFG